jgi:hypothetical protein
LNDITDDGSPFEFSLAFDDSKLELRTLVESQAEPISDVSSWNAGLQLNEALRQSGAYLGNFDQVKGLFAPGAASSAKFSLWHGTALKSDSTLFKAYLNPQIHGAAAAPGLVEKALRRLGRGDAWAFLANRIDPRERGRDLRFFSVDLLEANAARVKVYVARSTLADVEELVRDTKNVKPGAVGEWLSALVGSITRFDARPILTCFAFSTLKEAPNVTVHVPVRCYSPNDVESLRRIQALLSTDHAARLEAALIALAERPLQVKTGIVTYASLTQAKGKTRVTVYLAPECYSSGAKIRRLTATSGTRRIDRGGVATLVTPELEKAIEHHLDVLVRHPFLKRLDGTEALTQFRSALRPMALFSLVLEDVKRLAQELGNEPWLKEIAQELDPEGGTQKWWELGDLELLGISSSLEWLFGEERRSMRDALYRLASQVMAARSDYARLAVLLALHVITRELFVRASAYLSRTSVLTGRASIAPPPSQRGDLLHPRVLERLKTVEATGAAFGEIDAALSSAFAVIASLADELEVSLEVA